MRFTALAAGLVAPLLVSAAPAKFKRASDNDKLVLQFAEVLEQLETEFYKQALDKFVAQDFIDAGITVPDVAIQNFQAILAHETAHTQFLDAALMAVGAEPVQGCSFNFDTVLTDVATMAAVARVVEAVGVGAYLGGAVLVDDKNVLVAAGSILTIEARHQSFLNTINGAPAVPQAFDIALTPPQVLALAGGFISGCDLGIPANLPLTITNEGAIGPGTLLTFDPAALANAGDAAVSCQLLVGGQPTAQSMAIDQCIIPEGLNGPLAIFLTTSDQPLAADVVVQNAAEILAGPTLVFIDPQGDALGALVRNGGGPVDSSEEITPDQAQDELAKASGETSAALEATESAPENAADAAASSTDSAAPADATPAESNIPTTTPTPAIKVIGHSSIPA